MKKRHQHSAEAKAIDSFFGCSSLMVLVHQRHENHME
jgi:hypothetical protein